MPKLLTAVAAALAAAAASAPASATVYLATYTGIVVGTRLSAFDVTGVFGLAGQGLNGAAYRVVYRIDDAVAGTPIYIGPEGPFRNISSLTGGADYDSATPVTATITINGVAVVIDGANYDIAKQTHGNFDQTYHYVDGGVAAFGAGTAANVQQVATLFEPTEFLTSADLRTPLDVDLSGFDVHNVSGSFSIYQNNAAGYRYAFGQLSPAHLTIAAAAVPEPAAWSLLIAGFGLIGAARRRQAAVRAA